MFNINQKSWEPKAVYFNIVTKFSSLKETQSTVYLRNSRKTNKGNIQR